MLRPRLNPARHICRIEVSALAAIMVVLVTLVICATPMDFPHHNSSVSLPIVSHSVALWGSLREDALQIAIMRDGQVFFGTQRLSPEELTAKLQERVRAGAPRKVYIRADVRVHYRGVKMVLDEVRSAGLTNVAFITEKLQDRNSP
jgi:biopolymer transport protein ExbD